MHYPLIDSDSLQAVWLMCYPNDYEHTNLAIVLCANQQLKYAQKR